MPCLVDDVTCHICAHVNLAAQISFQGEILHCLAKFQNLARMWLVVRLCFVSCTWFSATSEITPE